MKIIADVIKDEVILIFSKWQYILVYTFNVLLKTFLGASRRFPGERISFTVTRHVTRSEVKGSFE
jgi:hypothetical protein